MKTSLQGLNCSLRYPHFLHPFCVRQADDEENPCKSRTFGLPEREIAPKRAVMLAQFLPTRGFSADDSLHSPAASSGSSSHFCHSSVSIHIVRAKLLGNKNAYKILINSLTRPQTICNPQTGATMTCRLLSVSGKWPNKTVRLYKGALPILEWIEPGMRITTCGRFGIIDSPETNHTSNEITASPKLLQCVCEAESK